MIYVFISFPVHIISPMAYHRAVVQSFIAYSKLTHCLCLLCREQSQHIFFLSFFLYWPHLLQKKCGPHSSKMRKQYGILHECLKPFLSNYQISVQEGHHLYCKVFCLSRKTGIRYRYCSVSIHYIQSTAFFRKINGIKKCDGLDIYSK